MPEECGHEPGEAQQVAEALQVAEAQRDPRRFAVLYEDHFTAETTSPGHADRLASLYTMFEQFEEDVLGIVTPKTKTVQRFLFTD